MVVLEGTCQTVVQSQLSKAALVEAEPALVWAAHIFTTRDSKHPTGCSSLLYASLKLILKSNHFQFISYLKC